MITLAIGDLLLLFVVLPLRWQTIIKAGLKDD